MSSSYAIFFETGEPIERARANVAQLFPARPASGLRVATGDEIAYVETRPNPTAETARLSP